MLGVLFLEEACLLESWILLSFKLQEAADDPPDVSDVVSVLPLIELELIIEQVVLLLEDSDVGKAVR